MAFAKFEDNVYYFKYKGNNDYDMFVYCDYKYNYPGIYITHNVGGKNSDGSYYNMIIESHKDPKEDEINGMTWADYQDMGTYIGGGHFGSNHNDIYNAVKNDDDIYEFFTEQVGRKIPPFRVGLVHCNSTKRYIYTNNFF